MSDLDRHDATAALYQFRRARRRASVNRVLSRIAGQERPLLAYDEVRKKLHAIEVPTAELREIPLTAIVGSVGRYNDFTREFLPIQDSDEQRWVRVRLAMTGLSGVPPIEVYQIGDAYFVRDGNHRVSVARELGNTAIQAYVTPVQTRVPFTPDADPSALILAAEYTEFLERTGLDRLRPDADLGVTVPGRYEALLDHIEVHRYYLGLDRGGEVAYPDAVASWYDTIYTPVIETIRATGLLRGFERRTETDLYLWLSEHRARLEEETGFQLSSTAIAEGVAGETRLPPARREQVLSRVAEGEAPATPSAPSLAATILVALSGGPGGWQALEQALTIAEREGSQLYGLHVLPVARFDEPIPAGTLALRERFLARCAERGVGAQFAVAYGRPAEVVLERAVWTDLVVVGLRHPPGQGLPARLGSGYLQLLRASPRPLVAVPSEARRLERAVLAYDGSPRAQEALFATAYVAARWRVRFAVVSVADAASSADAHLGRARLYLERYGIDADYLAERGGVTRAILGVAEDHRADMILLGSYRYSRWIESVIGGVVEGVMMGSELPVLVV
jgi:nucleotide-binding universal stress UspA family protein